MIDLAGVWQLRDESGAYNLAIELPGDIHSALVLQGLIPDPFIGQQELEVQWVGRRTWILEREFTAVTEEERGAPGKSAVDPTRRAPSRWILAIDTVDCVAEIHINDQHIWSGTNMFVPVWVDVEAAGAVLNPGSNRMRITLKSAELLAQQRVAELSYPVPHTVYPVQSMHRNLVRKVQCHAGWDWGPALMVAGVYGRIQLRREPAWALRNVRGVPRQVTRAGAGAAEQPGSWMVSGAAAGDGSAAGTDRNDVWLLPVYIELNGPVSRDSGGASGGPGTHGVAGMAGDSALPHGTADAVVVVLHGPDGTEVAVGSTAQPLSEQPAVAVADGNIVLYSELRIQDPCVWWPAGYGTQPLYTVKVSHLGETRSFTTAFRTVELVSTNDDHGRSLFFRVNGRDLWAKGANWIPVDAFPRAQTKDRYGALLVAAVEANMNMLRVWGGGQYEQDIFYELCNELGILVWQDFMFSCSLYPSETWFLDEVRSEVATQVRRLMSHPCIALWCGNNENVGALGWYPESIESPGRYLIDYDRLNTGVVAQTVQALDDSRVFWPSSPAAGEGDFSDNWHDDSSGDMHYWSVWHEGKPFSAYHDVTPRFCSEFGFQSFPSLHGVAQFASPDQYNPTAPDIEHHQRHPRGNTVVAETMTRYFRVPFSFEDFLYLSQVQQALAIRTAVEFWRSRRPVSMGALYWQLNDLWPVVSWSSIEYDGRYKLLHHEARRFFAPVHLVCQVHEEQTETWILNDTDQGLELTVTIRYYDFRGGVLLESVQTMTAEPDSATPVDRTRLQDLPFEVNSAFLVAEAELSAGSAAGTGANRGNRVERGWTFLTEPKRCDVQKPDISIERGDSSSSGNGGSCRVRCSSAPVFWLTLESADPALHFGDNGLMLLPGETAEIPITRGADREWELPRFRHLRSTY